MEEGKFIVKDVTGVEKSKVEIEEQLLKKHDEKFEQEEAIEPGASAESSINEDDVLSYMNTKYGREAKSMDEYTAQKEEAEVLPDDVPDGAD